MSSRPGRRGGDYDGALTAPLGRGQTLARCEACGRAFPPREPELAARIVDLLVGAELTAAETALRLRRRRATVELELEQLRVAGVVDRLPQRGAGKGWRAQAWRLVPSPSLDRGDKPRTYEGAQDDLLPLVPFFVAVGAAGEASHRRGQVAFLGAAALFLVALLFEIEMLAQTRPTRRAA